MLLPRGILSSLTLPLLLPGATYRCPSPSLCEAQPPLQRTHKSMPAMLRQQAPEDFGGALAPPAPADPIYDADVWLQREQVRYADGTPAAGCGYCVSYLPFTVEGNHTRAALFLAAADENSSIECQQRSAILRSLADRIALSCECVVLMPSLTGGALRWKHAPLMAEVDAATRFLCRQYGAQALGIFSFGEPASVTAELVAQGALEAHALVLMAPSRPTLSALRELDAPLLCLMGDDEDTAANMRHALALNANLRGSYYVSAFPDCGPGFMERPSDEDEASAAEQAASFALAWFDRHVPESQRD